MDILQCYVDRGDVAGITILIHHKGKEIYQQNFGWKDIDEKRPMQRDSLFRIASMSKPITTVAMLTLVQEGKIGLFDSIEQWLPELANRMVMRDPNGDPSDVYPAERAITLHDLLTYQFGLGWGKSSLRSQLFTFVALPASDALGFDVHRLGPDDWMARIAEFPLLNQPGERWYYQIASDVLGVLMARVSGKPLPEFLAECLFKPLQMKDTSFIVPQEKRDRMTSLYKKSQDGKLVVQDSYQTTFWLQPPLFPSAAGGLISTIDDCARFGRMLLNKGELDGVRILSQNLVEAMTTDYLTPEQHTHEPVQFDRYDVDPNDGLFTNWGFGYGVAVRTNLVGKGPNIGSYYWPGAFGTTWIADPKEDLLAILFVQQINANPFYTQLGEDFLRETYRVISL